MSCLIIKSFLDALFIRRTIKNKTIFLWIFYFLLSLYCENNNNITLPKLFLSAAGVLVICLIAYDGKLHKKIAMVFLYHFIWIAIEMLLGYTIMSIVKGNDYANFELLCSIICKIIMLALVKIIPLVIDPSIECDMPSKYCFMLTVLPVISTVVVYNIFLITSRIDRLELIAFSTVSSTLILALNLLVYDIYIKLLEQTEIRRENAIYEKQISLFQEQIYVKETAMLNDKMVRDKFYHQLSFIKELVYQRELSQLNEFIDGIMQNKKIEKDGPANSGNVLLDYIVNNKCEIAVKQGIECTVKIEVPYKFPFSDGDIFIILGNALDNAIEGALKCVSKIEADIKRPSIITYQKIMDVLDADISINDEATANVAPENEADLMNAVEELTKEKTIIMIAHRLKTVRKADQILVIEKGRIAEQGTHDVLLQKNGIYSSFICSRKEAVSWKVQKHS